MVTRVQPLAQKGPVGQAVRQGNGTQAQAQTCSNQAGGCAQIDGAFHNGVKQQDREQKKINQCFNGLPHRAPQSCVAAQQVAAQNQGKIGKEELGKVHRARITATFCPQGIAVSPWSNGCLDLWNFLWFFAMSGDVN